MFSAPRDSETLVSPGLPTCMLAPCGLRKRATTVENSVSPKTFFYYFKRNLRGLGVSRGMAWTIRRDCLELWQDLVLQDMGEVDFHVFGKYWKLTSSPNTSKLVLGPPDWSSVFFVKARVSSQELSNKLISHKTTPKQHIFRSHFSEMNWFYFPEVVPWLSNKIEDQSGGPKTNREVFGDEVSFQYFPKT